MFLARTAARSVLASVGELLCLVSEGCGGILIERWTWTLSSKLHARPPRTTSLDPNTALTARVNITLNNMDHPANNTNNYDEEGSFEQVHHKVFLVHSPTNVGDKYCRFFYVETNSLGLGPYTGYRLSVSRSAAGGLNAQDSVQDRVCWHPIRSDSKARLRLVGWIQRKDSVLEDIRPSCEAVPRTDYHCCHQWTDAAITALRAASVLRPLRGSDDRSTIYGPEAPIDDPFEESI